MNPEEHPDPRIADFVLVTEIAESRVLAEPLFRRKYRQPAPPSDLGLNVFALIRRADGAWVPASYLVWRPFRDVHLSAGACTDGERLRRLDPDRQQRLRDAGGLMYQVMRYGEARLATASAASFGYTGDPRSREIAERCGYRRLGDHPHLIVRWNRELADAERRRLVAEVEALGPF